MDFSWLKELFKPIATVLNAIAERFADRMGRRKPRIHVVFNPQQCMWGIAGIGQPDGTIKKAMSATFWGTFSNDDDRQPVVITEAFPSGTEQQFASFQIVIPPRGRPVTAMVHATVLPIIGIPEKPLKMRFILKDQFRRRYRTRKTTSRWASSGIEKLPNVKD